MTRMSLKEDKLTKTHSCLDRFKVKYLTLTFDFCTSWT